MTVNPLPWAIFMGSMLSATQMTLPMALTGMLKMLAQSASPVALFTLGCMLARTRRQSETSKRIFHSSDVGIIIALKLLLHPFLVWISGQVLMRMGFPLDPFGAMVLVLIAALPSASNVPILAERFSANAGRLALVVMGSTVLAFCTFTGVVLAVVPDAMWT
jgi:predicted permease